MTDRASSMTSEQIVARFVEISIQQDEAILANEVARFNRLYSDKVVLVEELKSRAGDQRQLLTGLYQHPNPQVRLNAANATLASAPAAARAVLEDLRKNKLYSQALDAGMDLRALDQGIYKPT